MPVNVSPRQRTISVAKRRRRAPPRAGAEGPRHGLGHRAPLRETRREAVDDGWGTLDQAADEETLGAGTTVVEEQCRRILSTNDSPDIASTSPSTRTAAASTAASTASRGPRTATSTCRRGSTSRPASSPRSTPPSGCARRWPAAATSPRCINIGSATDAYQPVERQLGITRAVIEVLAEARHRSRSSPSPPASSATSTWWARWGARAGGGLHVAHHARRRLSRIMEPRAAAPHRRLRTIEALARAGVPVGVSASPMIPFINEPELERILAAARDAGATARSARWCACRGR